MQQGIIEKNHMDILWHDYALNKEDTIPITKAGLIEKASVVGRCGMMLLSCGTGAWRVRSSMNTLSRELGISCTLQLHSDLPQHLPVGHLPFSLVADR